MRGSTYASPHDTNDFLGCLSPQTSHMSFLCCFSISCITREVHDALCGYSTCEQIYIQRVGSYLMAWHQISMHICTGTACVEFNAHRLRIPNTFSGKWRLQICVYSAYIHIGIYTNTNLCRWGHGYLEAGYNNETESAGAILIPSLCRPSLCTGSTPFGQQRNPLCKESKGLIVGFNWNWAFPPSSPPSISS